MTQPQTAPASPKQFNETAKGKCPATPVATETAGDSDYNSKSAMRLMQAILRH